MPFGARVRTPTESGGRRLVGMSSKRATIKKNVGPRAARNGISSDEEGVLKLMNQPHVLDAVLTVLAATKTVSNGSGGSSSDGAGFHGDSEERENAPSAAHEDGDAAVDTEEYAAVPMPAFVPSGAAGKATLPSLDAMREAGYQGSAGNMRAVWQWAKEQAGPNRDNMIWPAPTGGHQEPLRFDACGWPHASTTCEEWLTMLDYWTAMREQMMFGASRAQRNMVDRTLESFGSRRR